MYSAPDKQRPESGRISFRTQSHVGRVPPAFVFRAGSRDDATAELKEGSRTEDIGINGQSATPTDKIKPGWYLECEVTMRPTDFSITENGPLPFLLSSKHSVQEAAKLAYPAFGRKKTKEKAKEAEQKKKAEEEARRVMEEQALRRTRR
ncbi:hypothetical protein DL771_011029 [Monosporascus sp. 5C6A]|nr:hypothetical protein DL771_011029 [Monosporascus sp. 5C6A]